MMPPHAVGVTPGTPKLRSKHPRPSSALRGIEEADSMSPTMSMRERVQWRQQLLSNSCRLDVSNAESDSATLFDERANNNDCMSSDVTPFRGAALRTPSRWQPHGPESRSVPMRTLGRNDNDTYVNVSDDLVKNPILANSVRSARMRKYPDDEDVERSLKVLGASRCWTDRLEESSKGFIGVDLDDDDMLATQTPIRSFNTVLSTSQSDYGYDSTQPASLGSSYTQWTNASPISTPGRSTGVHASSTPNRYVQTMFGTGYATDLDAFGGARLEDMRKEEVNPMAYARLPKGMISEARMGAEMSTLYKHFKNMCTFIRRSSMRSDRPYFKVVQLMVQRMSRKDFTMDQLRQMAWMAPNLITLKWVSISDSVRRRYKNEYAECRGDVISDVQVRIHKQDGKVCSSNSDFESTCFAFKSVLCAWVARCEAEYVQERGSCDGFAPDMALPMPMAALPTKHCRSLAKDNAMLAPMSTPTRSASRQSQCAETVSPRPTALLSANRRLHENEYFTTSRTLSSPDSASNMSFNDRYEDDSTRYVSLHTKRMREAPMLPMDTELLDTPGMRRIRESAKRLATESANSTNLKEHDVSYWKDVRRFVNALVDLSIADTSPPVLRIEWLAEFMTKYGTKRVTYDNVAEWAKTLMHLAPGAIHVGVSKFDDYSTVLTFGPQPTFDSAIRYVNQRINACNK
ncbi:DNA replication factor CDT1 like family member, putative [Babesia ovata]|uniref:DNA replication factor CDT1 like family member, putative n=1 Tax=Babesia ovata TaxID=189622 RepID=A0A2H6K7Z2_9APIC|nr:DNA replication factor CDT1 like family member, putative [Babesia ovata]GBE59122.1 DNA replication factor CDT1 like family member, putative [Babesia ovata]